MFAPQTSTASTAKNEISLNSWNDQSLINCVVANNEFWREAFAALMERYKVWIYRRCLFRLGHVQNAEDASHEITLRIYGGLQGFQGRSNFRTWLCTIVDNYCNSFAVRHSRYDLYEHIEQLIELQDRPNMEWLEDEKSVISQVMSEIPATAQEVLKLRFYLDCSLEEIARRLELTLSAAKARLYRALALFKQQYLEVNGEQPLPFG